MPSSDRKWQLSPIGWKLTANATRSFSNPFFFFWNRWVEMISGKWGFISRWRERSNCIIISTAMGIENRFTPLLKFNVGVASDSGRISNEIFQ